jgi:CHAT domain-containing protein
MGDPSGVLPGGALRGRTPTDDAKPDSEGTRADLLEWLRGDEPAAVMHLACHGVVEQTEGAGDTSFLLLASGDRLSAEELVGLASARPIALAVLAACSSGVCGRGDDEAFSLCTTLLTGPARAVIGTQWSVPDEASSVFMFMLHHYLRVAGLAPRDALRQAQLWMTAPDRRPPADMPFSLRSLLKRTNLAAPVGWAAFVHFGR